MISTPATCKGALQVAKQDEITKRQMKRQRGTQKDILLFASLAGLQRLTAKNCIFRDKITPKTYNLINFFAVIASCQEPQNSVPQ